MILIADSGSTKTDWVIIKDNVVIFSQQGMGLNPNFFSDKELADEIKKSFDDFSNMNSVSKIFFYGSGCGKPENALRLYNALRKVFISADDVNVETDMLGAVRSFDLPVEVIVCILGTGSNVCRVQNGTILFQAPSFGYLLGDFGSGCDIGKRTISAFLERKFSPELHHSFKNWLKLSDAELLSEIYSKPRPNRFFASITLFHSHHLEDSYLREIRRESFNDFFDRQLSLVPEAKKFGMYCVGSVGYKFQREITEEGMRNGFRFERIHKSPIEGLINYHCKNK